MSTKNIRAVLAWARSNAPSAWDTSVADALSELGGIESAARIVVDVLSKAPNPQEEEPMTDALAVLERIAKESA